jgi:chromosomal replication initiator protein DnaA
MASTPGMKRFVSKPLGQILIERGLITPEQLKKVLEVQKEKGGLCGEIMVSLGYATQEDILNALIAQSGLPYLPPGSYDIDPEVTKLLPEEVIMKYCLIPVDRIGRMLTVVTSDPTCKKSIEEVETITNCKVQLFVASISEVREAIKRYYGKPPGTAQEVKKEEPPGIMENRTSSGVEEQPRNSVTTAGPAPTVEENRTYEIPADLLPLKEYTFANFVVGKANEFTYATAKAVAELPGKTYNPLFIFGSSGIGKTHLLNAIGNLVLSRNGKIRVIYISSERFTRELISAISEDGVEDFRNRYRTIDLLLLDDVQFLAGKERAQEEFFHTFNALFTASKQIVLTSDRPPREIDVLEERLKSRFAGGIITDITLPDLETRIAILKREIENENLQIPDDVLPFLCEKICSNIRELQGALKKVIAFSTLTSQTISLELAKNAIRYILKDQPQNLQEKQK